MTIYYKYAVYTNSVMSAGNGFGCMTNDITKAKKFAANTDTWVISRIVFEGEFYRDYMGNTCRKGGVEIIQVNA